MAQYLNDTDRKYHDVLQQLLTAPEKKDRTGVGTRSLFGTQLRFDLGRGFPILTTKRVNFKAVVVELLWFLRGDTNIKYLHEHAVHIWDEWADKDGNLGPVYGSQWRSWPAPNGREIDQIANLIKSLKENPDSRRHIVTAWNPAEIDQMALPPCHMSFQFYVHDGQLSCYMYQRSADWFLGVPFNIASYALLTHIIANEVGLGVGDLIMSFGDYHLYSNHMEAAQLQLCRSSTDAEPWLVSLIPGKLMDEFEPDDFTLVRYSPQPWIKADIAV